MTKSFEAGRKKFQDTVLSVSYSGKKGVVEERKKYIASGISSTLPLNQASRLYLNTVHSITLASYQKMWTDYAD